MMSNVQVLERTTHRTPLGLQVWDIATATHLIEGLEIQITSGTRATGTRAVANRSGVYCAFNIPGLRQQFEWNENDTDAWKTQRYQIEVRDPAGRFLPFVFDADLPIRDLLTWLSSKTSPPQPFIVPSHQSSVIQRIPLFSSVSRPVPDTLAVVRAELREIDTNRPAAWSLLKVSMDTTVLGIGLADQKGRVAILFPYPKRSSPALPPTPPAISAFRWDIELTAYYTPWQTAVPDAPDLAYLVKQFDSPRKLIQSMELPTKALSAQVLEYRKPLTVRTEISATKKPSSFLFVNTADMP
jgi:hypothetical protein